MTLRRFRTRPVEVTAVQWTGDNWDDIQELLDAHGLDAQHVRQDGDELVVHHAMRVRKDEWLVHNPDVVLHPSQHMSFISHYDEIGAQPVEDEGTG